MEKKQADSSSIAGQIAASKQLERLGNYLICNLFIVLFSVISWCMAAEANYFSFFDIDIPRGFFFDFEPFKANATADTFWAAIGSGIYTFGDYSVKCGAFAQALTCGICLMGMVQAVIWVVTFLPEYFRAKKMLSPLNKIAVTATELTAAAHNSQYNFDDIESAIGSIDPMDSDIHISTGNRDLKRIEQAINDLLDRMRNAYKSQSRFVSDASHELRTPIAVIKGYADMLDRWGKTDEKILDEGITAIKNESENMNKLVEQLLFLARGDNGRQPVNMTEFSLSDMIREVHSEAEMIDPDHVYNLDIKDELSVYADVSMMKQTARILCDNAKKYTPKGNTITLRVMSGEKGEKCFEIQDTGIGIDEKDIPLIFDRFFRSDPARTRETGGTGLGLSIAKWIVDRHGGHFEVISYKDIGTRITVCLPNTPAQTDNNNTAKQAV
ncbi:MAG: HAMP domain-containing histidine kinase [Oscillospiraceae bacterium]|nr:HAMP domain-containing histidine kinase [Oscillospiraceae bacterium]